MPDISKIADGLTTWIIKDEVSRRALADIIDGNSKNKIDLSPIQKSRTINGVTFVTDAVEGTVTVNGTPSTSAGSTLYLWSSADPVHPFDYATYLSGAPSGGGSSSFELQSAIGSAIYRDYGSGVEIPAGDIRLIGVAIRYGYTADNLVFRPMLCSEAAHNLSSNFIPYYPNNAELYAMIKALQS